jgi:EmrB/QacA subfamily drug resistance transporter
MQYKYTVLTNTTIGSFMALLDSNIVLISLPTIIRELPEMNAFEGLWTILGYQLITATLLLSFGRLADLYGRVRLYKTGFAIFTIGSATCSVALNGPMLVASRLLQGTGAALLFSNSAAIVTDAFPPNERGKALGINQVAGVTGSVSGLVLGGILTGTLGWRSIFWINIPVGIYATYRAHTHLKELSGRPKGEKLDPIGNSLFAIGLSVFLLALTLGAISGWNHMDYLALGVGVVMLVSFLVVETRNSSPMIDMKLFKIRMFSAGILANFLSSLARGTVSLLFVFYFQGALLLDALTTGIRMLPFTIAFVSAGPVSGYLSDRYGSRGLASGGLLLSSIAYIWFSMIPADVGYSTFMIPMILAGVGGGMFASPNSSSIMSSVPVTRRGVAAGTSSTVVNTGSLLSLSMSFVIMASSVPVAVLDDIFSGTPVASGSLNLLVFMHSWHTIFTITAAISLVAVIPSLMRGKRSIDASPSGKVVS